MQKTGFSWFKGLVLTACMVFAGGCVSEKVQPEHRPKLGVSQNSDGWVVIRLETTVGYKYKILYEDPVDRTWKPLKDCESITGTGEAFEIRKRFNARKKLPPFTVTYSSE